MLKRIQCDTVVGASERDQMPVRLIQWVWMSAPKHVNTVCTLSNMECKWNAGIQQLYFYIFRLSSPVEMVLCVSVCLCLRLYAAKQERNIKRKVKKKKNWTVEKSRSRRQTKAHAFASYRQHVVVCLLFYFCFVLFSLHFIVTFRCALYVCVRDAR